MKIRTDFVTNSSSSSFSLILTVQGTDGSKVTFEDSPDWEAGGEASFDSSSKILRLDLWLEGIVDSIHNNRDVEYELEASVDMAQNVEKVKPGDTLKIAIKAPYSGVSVYHGTDCVGYLGPSNVTPEASQLLGKHLAQIVRFPELMTTITASRIMTRAMRGKLARKAQIWVKVDASIDKKKQRKFLMDSVDELARFLMDSTINDYGKKHSKDKQRFLSQMIKNFTSMEQIESISVAREYSAWGESAALIPENDQKLKELSESVVTCSEEDRPQALQLMREYVTCSDTDRQHIMLSFGSGYKDFRYSCSSDDETLLGIAKRLCSHRCTGNVSGREYEEINLRTGEKQSYAIFDLQPYCFGMDQYSIDDILKMMEEKRHDEEIASQRMEKMWQRQKNEWLARLAEILTPNATVDISKRVFVLTGFRNSDNQSRYEHLIAEQGGLIRKSVSGKTDYLVIDPAERIWNSQIAKALEQKEKGTSIQIVLSEDLDKAIDK